ncbi:hypothetical protein [Luteibacter sp. CQ10]|uniref:hypothetical protein n=1 Tax=Luteibacter sp. CQ10 TaxID=2805821 RepID=UPI0034A3DFDC
MRKVLCLIPLVLSGCAATRPVAPVDLHWIVQRPGVFPAELTQSLNPPGSQTEETILGSDPHVSPMHWPVRIKISTTLSALDHGVRHAHVKIEADEMASEDIRMTSTAMTIGGQVVRHLQPGEHDIELRDGVPVSVDFADGFVFTVDARLPEDAAHRGSMR